MSFLSKDFLDFIKPDCNRLNFIQNFLKQNDVETAVIPLEGKKHIYVKFPQNQYNPLFKIKTVVAHYDRFENSPGANDNSAAVYMLMLWAVKLSSQYDFHNVRLIFTDGEEACPDGVTSQGAFAIASLFKKLDIKDDIFVFDCMGCGDVPVLCENKIPQKAGNAFIKKLTALENKAQRIIRTAGNGKWFCLPCNYSDNASFIAQGIPAVAITILPSSEVSDVLKNQTPKTWKNLHTQNDNIENLWESSFSLSMKIFDLLAQQKDASK
ncbi:MAG: M28 family peptidase [Treponema sp.]|nr:M28 family peptidase [Treponema sp.]